jgi:predicted N-acetyltransferase YhbS
MDDGQVVQPQRIKMDYTIERLPISKAEGAAMLLHNTFVEKFKGPEFEDVVQRRYGYDRILYEVLHSYKETFPHSVFFIAQSEGNVIGVAGLKEVDWALNTYTLFLAAVNSEYRNQGIGSALIDARIDYIKEYNPSARLLVSTTHKARYEKFGFKVADLLGHAYTMSLHPSNL